VDFAERVCRVVDGKSRSVMYVVHEFGEPAVIADQRYASGQARCEKRRP
jgi:hypothetical protein